MKPRETHWNTDLKIFETPGTTLFIQAPLPRFDAWPILITIEGPGSGRQGPSPSAPPEEPAND